MNNLGPTHLPAETHLGKIKSFGHFGPKYRVDPVLGYQEDLGWVVLVTLIESGEEAEYAFDKMLLDPEAH